MPHPIKRYINTCKICNKFFEIQLSLKTRKVTCSKECSSIHKSNMRIGKKHNLNPIYKKCIRCYVDYQTNGTIKKQFPSPNTQVSIGSVISVTTTSGGK